MNIKAKTGLVIITTLVIGILLGSIFSGLITKNSRRHRRTSATYMERLEKRISQGETIQDTVKTILGNHEDQVGNIITQFWTDMRTERDSLKKDLENVLTPEQKERAESFLEGRRINRRRTDSGENNNRNK
jgi:hypothetical protein